MNHTASSLQPPDPSDWDTWVSKCPRGTFWLYNVITRAREPWSPLCEHWTCDKCRPELIESYLKRLPASVSGVVRFCVTELPEQSRDAVQEFMRERNAGWLCFRDLGLDHCDLLLISEIAYLPWGKDKLEGRWIEEPLRPLLAGLFAHAHNAPTFGGPWRLLSEVDEDEKKDEYGAGFAPEDFVICITNGQSVDEIIEQAEEWFHKEFGVVALFSPDGRTLEMSQGRAGNFKAMIHEIDGEITASRNT